MDAKQDFSAAITLQLGQWLSELELSSIPDDVISHLKLCLLDSIGCGLYGATQPWGRIVGDVAVRLSGGGTA